MRDFSTLLWNWFGCQANGLSIGEDKAMRKNRVDSGAQDRTGIVIMTL